MGMHLVHSYEGTVIADLQSELPPLDLSRGEQIYVEAKLTGNAGADATDKLNIRLQNRWQSGVWSDRAALAQLTGAMTSGELRDTSLSKFVTLSDTEEADEPSGSTGGTPLAAGTVRNGPFPGPYVGSAGKETAWRLNFDITDASDPSFPVAVSVYLDSVD